MTFAKKGHAGVPDLPGQKLINIPANHMHPCTWTIHIPTHFHHTHTFPSWWQISIITYHTHFHDDDRFAISHNLTHNIIPSHNIVPSQQLWTLAYTCTHNTLAYTCTHKLWTLAYTCIILHFFCTILTLHIQIVNTCIILHFLTHFRTEFIWHCIYKFWAFSQLNTFCKPKFLTYYS